MAINSIRIEQLINVFDPTRRSKLYINGEKKVERAEISLSDVLKALEDEGCNVETKKIDNSDATW